MTLRFTLLFFLITIKLYGQNAIVYGKISTFDTKRIVDGVVLLEGKTGFADIKSNGVFELKNVAFGKQILIAYCNNYETVKKEIFITSDSFEVNIILNQIIKELDVVVVQAEREKTYGITRLKSVENFGIYEGKKTEVVVIKDITANLATNNARQIFAKVAGLNIWESDGVGLQLGIGGRGLSPNRTANFNTRQNGYDISADALGYPESYYTPPVEALERIEVVRGAASLQYGTQFGGMVNFRFKKAPKDKKIELVSRQTAGSWGFLGSFNSVAGTIGKFSYYTFYQRKQGDGWRPNSGFKVNTGFLQIAYKFSENFDANFEVTKLNYLAQQAGGLSDKMFAENPRQSVRYRNWFKVDWNLAALNLNYTVNERTKINSRTFGLVATRQSLGNLERIIVDDKVVKNRTLIDGNFDNIGNETRLLHRYKANNVLVGFRAYKGVSSAKQGDGDDTANPNFRFINPNNLENSDYVFPNYNYAVFVENIFQVTSKWSVTPGVRYEFIKTISDGYYKQRVFDFAGNLIVESKLNDTQTQKRDFVIFGVGTSYKPNDKIEVYGNISQNYRAINFSDLRIVNPNFAVDSNLVDEKGFTADIGFRGNLEQFFNFDVSLFLINYKGKIGQLLKADRPPLFLDYRLRTNISDARNLGLELFGELNLLKMIQKKQTNTALTLFGNFALVQAKYINTQDNTIKNKKVEMVPPVIIRSGLSFKKVGFSSNLQFSYVGKHFSDATNAIRTSTAVEGIISAYKVMDLSMAYNWRWLGVEASCNNLLNEMYFTRRAEAYPGPGIIPSDGRGFYATFQVKF